MLGGSYHNDCWVKPELLLWVNSTRTETKLLHPKPKHTPWPPRPTSLSATNLQILIVSHKPNRAKPHMLDPQTL